MERIIDGKYSAVIKPAEHRPTCNKVTTCDCLSGPPSVAIINRATGIEIPEDEPLILFRGKDTLVRGIVTEYYRLCANALCPSAHTEGVMAEIYKLDCFAAEHPERMKVPD